MMRDYQEYSPIDGEEWKVIDIRPRYSVSSLGRIRFEWFPGEYRMVKQHRYGAHIIVGLSQEGKHITKPVATLVAEAFLGDRPEGGRVIHKDLNYANNSASNLQYASGAEYRNYISRCQRELHGRTGADSRAKDALAKKEAREKKRALYEDVMATWSRKEITISEAAKYLGISQSAVSRWRSRHEKS